MMSRLLMILLLASVSASPAQALDDALTVKLEAMNNSGQSGFATLFPEGGKTRVVIELLNTPPGVAQPAHIHAGRCDTLDKAPKWPLEALKGGRSVTLVPVSLDAILQDKTAINIHKSAAEVQVYVACGNIVGVM
ncbi:MAG: hypothetical protein B7Y33_01530 [Hydrogenophilales bacterium 16-62-9]|nr:MAG: hypothetical protein B7Y33_01530 [Hydrogenophilales bacterium 16-62-9]